MNKVSAVWCAWFDGSTIEDFLAAFREILKNCAIAVFFSGKGRAVQMWNSIRHLETPCRMRKALSQHEIEDEAAHAVPRLLFT